MLRLVDPRLEKRGEIMRSDRVGLVGKRSFFSKPWRYVMPNDLSPKPNPADGPSLTRRSLLAGGAAAGAALLYGAGPAGAMRTLPRTFKRTSAETVTFGSNYSDAVPKAAMANVLKNFTAKTGIEV